MTAYQHDSTFSAHIHADYMLIIVLIIFSMKFSMDSTDFESGGHVDLLALGFSAFISMAVQHWQLCFQHRALARGCTFPHGL
jgi:hypothetical protein